jgi:hypothetical protein
MTLVLVRAYTKEIAVSFAKVGNTGEEQVSGIYEFTWNMISLKCL